MVGRPPRAPYGVVENAHEPSLEAHFARKFTGCAGVHALLALDRVGADVQQRSASLQPEPFDSTRALIGGSGSELKRAAKPDLWLARRLGKMAQALPTARPHAFHEHALSVQRLFPECIGGKAVVSGRGRRRKDAQLVCILLEPG